MRDVPLRVERFRVAMGDTDAAALIYFGAPLRWAERILTAYLADSGVPTSGLLADGRGLPAVEASLRYRLPLRLDDPIRAELHVQQRTTRSVTWRCEIFRGEENEAAVQVVLTQVSVRLEHARPVAVALPQRLAENLRDRPTTQEQP